MIYNSINDFDLGDDLPLHICGLSLYLSTYALWKKDQLAFELAYFWADVNFAYY